jgi:hypothetical protein
MQEEVEMVPETPPRRSRSTKEPVTIDLTAEEVGLVAEPVRSTDTDEPPVAERDKHSVEHQDAGAAEAAVEAPEAGHDAIAKDDEGAKADTAADALSSETVPASETTRADAETGRMDDEAALGAKDEESVAVENKPAEQPAFDEPPVSAHVSEDKTSDHSGSSYTTTPQGVPPEKPQRQSPATSTLIAAGIAGGIVALLLAGSMQYAGYLPGAKPATDSAPAADASALSSEIASLRQEVDALRNQPPAAAATGPDSAVADQLQGQIQTLQSQIAAMKSASDAAAASEQDVTRRLAAAEAKINDRGPEQQVARAVAAAALKAAIDRGGTFQTELDTFASVAGNDPAIQQLQPFATRGVPSRISLQQEFPRVADAMLEAANQPNPNASIADRLMSSAMSVVKVRRVGEVAGDTPEAKVARVENALQNGDLAAAAREWVALPDASKAVAGDFKQRLDARIQVENLVGGTLTRAIAGSNG